MGLDPISWAAIAIGGGAITSLIGAKVSGDAQKDAGNAQLTAARETIAAQTEARTKAVELAKEYGPLQPNEIASINKVIQTRDAALTSTLEKIGQHQKYLDSLDPEVKQAGKNLLELMQGKASDALAPVTQQRDKQRTELENQLSSTLGPGFRTSSAGIEALNKFDSETNLITAQTQNNFLQTAAATFGSLFGQQQGGAQAIVGETRDAFGAAMLADTSVLQADQFAAARTSSAVSSAFNGNQPNYGLNTQVAGAPFAGQATAGNTLSQLGGGLLNLGGRAVTAFGPPTPAPEATAGDALPYSSSGGSNGLAFTGGNYGLPTGVNYNTFGNTVKFAAN